MEMQGEHLHRHVLAREASRGLDAASGEHTPPERDPRAVAEAERDAARRTLAETEATLRSTIARLQAMDAELRGTRAMLSEARSQGALAQKACEEAQAIIAEGAAHARHVEAELAAQQARAGMMEQRLHAILASSSWRALAPLQRHADLYPALRRMLRRAGLLLPWVGRAAGVTTSRLCERHAATLPHDHLPPEEAKPPAARDAAGARARRLLMIDDLLPLDVNGAGLPRARAIVTSAVAEGWSVTHYPVRQPTVPWERLRRELPASVEVIDQRGGAGLASFLDERADHYDAILVSRPHNMALFRAALAGRPDLPGQARVIYDAEAIYALRDAAQALMEGRPLPAEEAERRVAEEIRHNAAGVEAVLCVTSGEEELFRRHLPGQPVHRLAHLPAARMTARGHAARRGFLFIGRLMEPEAPNWQGLAWFLRSCWPLVRQALPDAELAVVGLLHPDHAALAAPGVRLVGPVEDLQPFYEAARVFLAPVRIGAGVSIKVVEAAAAGLPVVCTRLIARQLGWQEAGALAAQDDPAELAAEAVALHEDASGWQAMRDRAGELVRRDFSAARFQAALAAALAGPAGPAHPLPGRG
ncbi:MAG TPA: glycosyltransferase [Roseococcus sp.]|jgi:glycosyltransferase involved in cell wall biosynthesis|nr:glycosyltransferase [Roseococcus sp.]